MIKGIKVAGPSTAHVRTHVFENLQEITTQSKQVAAHNEVTTPTEKLKLGITLVAGALMQWLICGGLLLSRVHGVNVIGTRGDGTHCVFCQAEDCVQVVLETLRQRETRC